MSFHHYPSALTSRQAAVENLPADPGQQRQLFNDLFAARDRQREELAKVREAQKVRAREEAMTENLGIEPIVIKSMKMWGDAFGKNRYRAAKAFTQFMIFSNAQGFGDEVEAPEDETPVMDRTRTAKRMVGFSAARGGSRASYGMTIQTAKQMEISSTAERIYQKLRNGVPVERLREGEGAGRPSNAWQEAYQIAVERIADEDGGQAEAAE